MATLDTDDRLTTHDRLMALFHASTEYELKKWLCRDGRYAAFVVITLCLKKQSRPFWTVTWKPIIRF